MKTAQERFWARVDKAGPIPLVQGVTGHCWVWTGLPNDHGYGRFSVERRILLAHRWAYMQSRGAIPAGLELDHLCRQRECVRPDHLEAVTHAENVRRGNAGMHHSAKTHCKNGHPFNEANTRHTSRQRVCLPCARARNAAYEARLKEAQAA